MSREDIVEGGDVELQWSEPRRMRLEWIVMLRKWNLKLIWLPESFVKDRAGLHAKVFFVIVLH